MPSQTDLANAIRVLAMDAVQSANSGHPGAPMGMADIAEVLWNKMLSHNPCNPQWPNRDRFVLSNGHGSMLIYSLLYLSGYDLSIEDLKSFRQLKSRTPGHPEYGHTPGIETTTGPLGQGLANAVGMALAERTLGAEFNRDGHKVVDHFTWVFLGDGCLMEGISHEACSLAGTLGLGKLIAIYDDNGISIDGKIGGWFTDDTRKRFEAYGWHVVSEVDGHDASAVELAFRAAKAETNRPSIVCCKTIIGKGSPNKQGTESCHGSALGEEEVRLARAELDWDHPPFHIPAEILNAWDARVSGIHAERVWQEGFDAYRSAYPLLAEEFSRRQRGELPQGFEDYANAFIESCVDNPQNIASRKASFNVLNALAPRLPELLGGSADLAGSNLSYWNDAKGISIDSAAGNYIYYGVREFAMAAMMNGVALHGGFIPFGATFLIFMEYARNAVRMSALMNQRVIYVFTHDSIGLGEDGPTHQPVEQLSALRATPNLHTWRPCDAVESAVAWKKALLRDDGPSALIFSRQTLAAQITDAGQVSGAHRGGYILVRENGDKPDAIVIATGSELKMAVDAALILDAEGLGVRVVSMPCTEVFDEQDFSYREMILPSDVIARISVEAGHTSGWHKYVGFAGRVFGIDSFGESAPASALFEHFGLTTENLVAAVREILSD